VEHVPYPGSDEEAGMKKVLGQYDVPAFLNRALRVKNAFERVIQASRAKRDQELEMVRVRLGVLRGLVDGDWKALRPLLADDAQVAVLRTLLEHLQPKLEVVVTPTTSARRLRGALDDLCRALEAFNVVWRRHLAELDLAEVNREREGYNRWYVLEKECALRSPALARRGFTPLPPATPAEVAALLPELPVPSLAAE
jgi:hypothetical protein